VLDPDDRLLLLDALRPPAAYAFDRAVGTSFTLDLHALLTTPLALAAFDWEATDGAIPDDPVALLESLRRCSDRIDFFCQAGEIRIPPAYHRMYAWLERSVHEAMPQQRWALFHPKIWLLRYRPVDTDGPNTFRLLCASRNLTFDRNWDILLALDGTSGSDNPNGQAVGHFVTRLPSLAVHPLAAARRREITALGREVAQVRFTPPPEFDHLDFHFLDAGTSSPLPTKADRVLVISPFVTEDAAERLLAVAPRVSILSRAEEMDRLPGKVLDRFEDRFVLSPAAVPVSDVADDSHVLRPLVGLHAKLYVTEDASRATWYAGSANATSAAFAGNVEAIVELRGAKHKVGIGQLLADVEGGLYRLLQEHPLPQSQLEPTDDEELQTIVEGLRRAIAAARFVVTVSAGDSGYTLSVTCDPLAGPSEGTASIVIRPLSLPTGQQVTAGAAVSLTFGPMSLESVTPFIVIEIVARRQGTVVHDACVIRAELVGEPTGRADHLLASLLASRRDVLRYLLFLLADAGGTAPGGWFGAFQRAVERGVPTGHADGIIEMPLLETLVRTTARDPLKLVSVQRLVDALGRTDEGRTLLPDGFAEIWPIIWEASKPIAAAKA
jgi:hypothetical protein